MNKLIKIIVLNLVFVLVLSACSAPGTGYPAPDWDKIPDPLPESLKGYELYSWQAGGEWVFTLTTGTNRIKSFDEITSTENKIEGGFVKITVTSIGDLVTLIERLPAGVDLLWSGIDLTGEVEDGIIYFTYPPDELMDRVVSAATEQGVQLHTFQTP
jgi:ABC-type glycerol-3-phosphate transport system substrate-binding protein